MENTEIYKINIEEIGCTEFNAAYFLMSPERRNKCDALKNADDKKRCIAADMLIRKALSETLGLSEKELKFGISDGGKPYLKNADCNFSISHSGKYVAAAVNRSVRVGIDIEKIKPVKAGIVRHIFTKNDTDYVFGGKTPVGLIEDGAVLERFFRVWTYKEAYVKMTGEGITDNVKSFSYDENKCFCEISDGYCLSVITE
ncbi:MAG: 4'-phosphopantetheinyl transferase superfamily protein [Clostridia bacterium]|nr:4'-phosphopantetheinyl transferase superfamily protein [Clostridia bacterium]